MYYWRLRVRALECVFSLQRRKTSSANCRSHDIKPLLLTSARVMHSTKAYILQINKIKPEISLQMHYNEICCHLLIGIVATLCSTLSESGHWQINSLWIIDKAKPDYLSWITIHISMYAQLFLSLITYRYTMISKPNSIRFYFTQFNFLKYMDAKSRGNLC